MQECERDRNRDKKGAFFSKHTSTSMLHMHSRLMCVGRCLSDRHFITLMSDSYMIMNSDYDYGETTKTEARGACLFFCVLVTHDREVKTLH